MNKKHTLAIAAAMLMGTAGMTSAAGNPFSDVPADHWAYDAVSQLASDGVIEGYGDATFQGGKKITRYEMAQMIARAMAKTNLKSDDKALIEKLSAEFSDELKGLGVRVANLERNADKVKFNGMLRLDYERPRYKKAPINLNHWTDRYAKRGEDKHHNAYVSTFRLEPTAEVNDHWKVKARVDGTVMHMQKDESSTMSLKRIWAQGQYGNTTYKLGRFGVGIDMDIMFDTQFSGGQVAFGNPHGIRTTLNAGRFTLSSGNQYYWAAKDVMSQSGNGSDPTADYAALGFSYNNKKWTNVGLAYHYLKSKTFGYYAGYAGSAANYSADDAKTHPFSYKEDQMHTLTNKATYHFDKNWALQYNYGHNFKAENYNDTFCYGIGYKDFENFNPTNAGQWGASVMYRYVGQNVGPTPTYTMDAGTKGVAFSIMGNPLSHIFVWLNYELGKDLINNARYDEVFTRLEYSF